MSKIKHLCPAGLAEELEITHKSIKWLESRIARDKQMISGLQVRLGWIKQYQHWNRTGVRQAGVSYD